MMSPSAQSDDTVSDPAPDMPAPDLIDRIVRYADLVPCRNAFIDTRSPGSDAKENFTVIGPGVSENPDQHIHIAEAHGFNIGGARQPPGCLNSQHSHLTAEVFWVHSGEWRFMTGETGEDAEVHLSPGDLISIPTGMFRGFENIGDTEGYLFAVLGGDDPGRVLWAPQVFDMAKDYGLVLLDNGNLIDIAAGETVPDGDTPMPATTAEQIADLAVIDDAALRECCIIRTDSVPSSNTDGQTLRHLIGPGTRLDWPHGFSVDHLQLAGEITAHSHDVPDVVFVHSGELHLHTPGGTTRLGPGDTATIPKGLTRSFSGTADIVRVLGHTPSQA